MRPFGSLIALLAVAAIFAWPGTTPAVAADSPSRQSPNVLCGKESVHPPRAPDVPEDCGGGGGWSCRNVSEDVYQDDGYGSYRMTLTLHYCPDGQQVSNCYVVDPAVYAHWFWYWQGWVTAPYAYGGGSSCSEYGQGHFKFSRPGWFDTHEYAWIRITGYPNGSYTTSEGR
jgi:hypothetical protein